MLKVINGFIECGSVDRCTWQVYVVDCDYGV
jgi:hypothetical protein